MVSQLQRRREASYRMAPLACGCRDPLSCRCHDDPRYDDEPAFAAPSALSRDELADLLAELLHPDTLRALWRGGRRDLAVRLARLTGAA